MNIGVRLVQPRWTRIRRASSRGPGIDQIPVLRAEVGDEHVQGLQYLGPEFPLHPGGHAASDGAHP
eukprot:3347292-Prymnesium_polylepis.1